jgi:hypothetical protein
MQYLYIQPLNDGRMMTGTFYLQGAPASPPVSAAWPGVRVAHVIRVGQPSGVLQTSTTNGAE